ncbi:MAG: hypothetical protein E7318_05590 [Clostridiales bacterium]|nr:hypothetical protein [Clostridiales bacterium]
MSINIKVSYEREEELQAITDRLQDLDLTLETAPQTGQWKRAYLKQKPVRRPVNPVKQNT